MSVSSNVRKALTAAPIHSVMFFYLGRPIVPMSFVVIGELIKQRKITCDTDPKLLSRTAEYDPFCNTIFVKDTDFGSNYWDEKALIVHEATHAMLDYYAGWTISGKKTSMREADDEVCGYLAGAMYLRAANANGSTKPGPEREASKLAKSIMSGNKSEIKTLQHGDVAALRKAIVDHPTYKGSDKRNSLHDGVMSKSDCPKHGH